MGADLGSFAQQGRALLAAVLLLGLACSDADTPPPDPPRVGPILVIGLDGLEWDVLLPLFREGRLPHLASFLEDGAYGLLESLVPTESPIIWTSIATGKTPDAHGIEGFVKPASRGQRLYTNADRKTKALWNIASDAGQRVCTVGWWMTYPVESIRGTMVAQTNTLSGERFLWKGALVPGAPGQVHPAERQAEFMAVLAEAEAGVDTAIERIFGTFPHALSAFEQGFWSKARWAFRADHTYQRIAHILASEGGCDILLVYVGGTDVVGHYFWRYHEPDRFEPRATDDQIENFGHVIRDYYAFADAVVGELVAAAPAGTTTFVLSDHGMSPALPGTGESARGRLEAISDLLVSGQHEQAPPGVLLARGPVIRATGAPPIDRLERPRLPTLGSVLDVTPTLLALLRIPLGRDMVGTAMTGIIREDFDVAHQPEPIATHDDAEFLSNRPVVPESIPGERERLEQLRALGYLDD